MPGLRGRSLPLRVALVSVVPRPWTAAGGRLDWVRDGHDWPNRAASRFVEAGGLRWHLQVMGQGPVLLLVHGTGASTHSWRSLAPRLATHFTVVAPDLPGHAFTDPLPPGQVSLVAMAGALQALLAVLALKPAMAVGHSAGAAILARMALDRGIEPGLLVSLNGALLPLPGVPGVIFAPMAKLLAASPLAARLFAWRAADDRAVARLIASTGSSLDGEGQSLYARLVRNPAHVAHVLAMMAHWDLRPMLSELGQLRATLVLLVATRDRTVPPAEARRVQSLLPAARIVEMGELGHLAHEERPEQVAGLLLELAAGKKLMGSGA
jgi:magnesium chelatase accessory protein